MRWVHASRVTARGWSTSDSRSSEFMHLSMYVFVSHSEIPDDRLNWKWLEQSEGTKKKEKERAKGQFPIRGDFNAVAYMADGGWPKNMSIMCTNDSSKGWHPFTFSPDGRVSVAASFSFPRTLVLLNFIHKVYIHEWFRSVSSVSRCNIRKCNSSPKNLDFFCWNFGKRFFSKSMKSSRSGATYMHACVCVFTFADPRITQESRCTQHFIVVGEGGKTTQRGLSTRLDYWR